MKLYSLLFASILVCILITNSCWAQNSDKILSIELKGIETCKFSVYSIAESKNNLIADKQILVNSKKIDISIPSKYLPGEFIVLFETAEATSTSQAKSVEKLVIINNDNVYLTVNPKFINQPDSSYFNKKDIENNTLTSFALTTMKNVELLEILQNFLLSYPDNTSEFYKTGIKEFETKRSEHNLWVDNQLASHKNLFCSNMFYFYYVPAVNWDGDYITKRKSVIDNYFTGMDFSNKNILRTSYLKSWMDNYVNKYVELAYSQEMIEDYFVEAGHKAIEISKTGDPNFYGWMVDYFFAGYESMNIQKGIEMLDQYIKDPNCLTYKRKEIEKRVTGIQSITPGTVAPDFSYIDEKGKPQKFHNSKTNKPYKLVLFWSADCDHCEALVEELYNWHKENSSTFEVFAISLDESDTEIPKWEIRHKQLSGWIHILSNGGINSKEAESYYILSTPSLFLIDSKTNKVISSPDSFEKLMNDIE